MTSIRQKIRLGAYLYVALAIVFAALAYSDLRALRGRVESGVIVYDFIEAVREGRNHEKNLFLYHGRQEYELALQDLQRADKLLRQHPASFDLLQTHADIEALLPQLETYRQRLQAYGPLPGQAGDERPALQEEIRGLGHRLQLSVHALQVAEREELEQSMRRTLLILLASGLLIAFLGVLTASYFARIAVRPLAWLEQQLKAIGQGRIQRLTPPSPDQELHSLAQVVEHINRENEVRNRQLLQSEKLASLGTLVSGIAHELNNPLSNISTSSQILLEELGRDSAVDPRPWLKQIDEETRRARDIVGSLLSFARDSEFQCQWWPLAEVVDEALLLLGRLRQEQVEREITPGLHAWLDRPRILQVLVNLLGNALDAGGSGVRISIQAQIVEAAEMRLSERAVTGKRGCPPRPRGPLLWMQIRDNGPGIEGGQLPRIFDPFYTTKEVGQGYGLGLYVCSEIIDRHQGCIAVESTFGEGTCFSVVLPMDQGEAES